MAAVYGSGSFVDPVPFAYSMDAIVKKQAPKYSVGEILTLAKKHFAQGHVLALEFRKYPGPPSLGPEGYREMTPIPATIYVRPLGSSIGIEIERSGYEVEKKQIKNTDLDTHLVQWLKQPYFERFEYVDSTDYKVVLARRSQIYGIGEYQLPQPVRSTTKAPKPEPASPSNQWLLVLAIILVLMGLYSCSYKD